MSKIFTNPKQLEEWVEAAEGIQERYGKGAIEHSIDTEVEDALIFRDMMKYFGINV